METDSERLKREIEEAKAKLEKLEKEEKTSGRNSAVKKLKEYTVEEKIKFFDKMYKNAETELKSLEKSGYQDEDSAQYAWELYISILSKDHKLFWKYFNSL